MTETTKQQFFWKIANKFYDPHTSSNVLVCLEKVYVEKFPVFRFFHENSFITDFREKTELSNSIFANKCLLITNSSVLFGDYELFTVESLSNIIFTDNSIGKSHKGFRLQQSSC